MRICQIDGAAIGAVRRAPLSVQLPLRHSALVRPGYLQQPISIPSRHLRASAFRCQSTLVAAASRLAIQSPSQALPEQMAGSRKAVKANQAVASADAAVGIKPDPEAVALNGLHAGNGVALEIESSAAGVNGAKQAKARKPRAKAVKGVNPAAEADHGVEIKADPETAALNGSHAQNGAAAAEEESLPIAANGVKQPNVRKGRSKASGGVKPTAEATVKSEPAGTAAADLGASIEMAKEGALLVTEETVRKGRGRKQQQQQQQQPEAAPMPDIPAAREAPKARGKRTKAAGAALPAIKSEETVAEQPLGEGTIDAPTAAPKKRAVRKAKSAKASIGEAAEAAVMAVSATVENDTAAEEIMPKKRAPRRKKAVADADTAAAEAMIEGEDKPKSKRQRRAKSAPTEMPVVEGIEGLAADPEAAGQETPKKKRRAKGPDPDAFLLPAREVLEIAQATPPPPRPVPNLGYACLNMDLREQRPPIFTNRGCIQKTWLEKGIDYVSELALENSRALAGIIQWNHEKGIRVFRLSSEIFPWCTEYEVEQLKDFDAIADELAFAGKLARAYDQRLTFHPSHFVKLAAETDDLLTKSIKELEVHSRVFDLMGFPPCHQNKINIHVGGIYGDKEHTMRRFAENFNTKCSPNLQARLTVENDDRPNSYSMTDLLLLHNLTSIPLVFDFHHQKFCPGNFNEKEALYAAVATWPKGIRPVVHWSESQEGRIPHAHSDYISGPMILHGLEKDIDVMIEAKCKERALLRFREAALKPPSKDDVMAMKFV